MESTPKSRSVGIAQFFKHISIAIWLNSLEYKFHGRDICPFLEKSTWNQPIPQSLSVPKGFYLHYRFSMELQGQCYLSSLSDCILYIICERSFRYHGDFIVCRQTSIPSAFLMPWGFYCLQTNIHTFSILNNRRSFQIAIRLLWYWNDPKAV